MPFYGKEFYDDERVWLMPLSAQGLYLAALWQQWQEGSIPADVSQLARLVGQPERDVRKAWESVSQFFSPGESGRLVNRKLETIRVKWIEFRGKRSAAGRKGNNVRWGERSLSDSQCDEGAIAKTSHSDSDSDSDSDSKKQIHGQFLEAWALYPRKVGKHEAERHYRAQVKSVADHAALVGAITNYRTELRALERGDEHTLHGSTFFNNRWRDYVDGVWKEPKQKKNERKLPGFVA